VTGDVAASGELGYTTGPYLLTTKASQTPAATGWFFSVWKRQGDDRWKVVADFGIEGPPSGPLRPRVFQRAEVRGVAPRAKPDAGAFVEQLRSADAAFAEDANVRGLSAAYKARSTSDVLAYRQGAAPVAGQPAVVSFMATGRTRLTWQPSYAAVSEAGDLGFTYGAYIWAADAGTEGRGFYLHVWKRRADGWKLAVDVANQ
jgi:ketosteroid isomerase-like protein